MLNTKGFAAQSAKTPLAPFQFQRREPGDHDVLIPIDYCGVCHSDIHQVRDEWGYGLDENLTNEELIHEKYRGIRPAPGYPACPDHTEKGAIWKLLDVHANTGMIITESFAMWPGSSVSGIYFAHPESRYFSLGKIDRDQVDDYHKRKGMTVEEVERWLGPNLNYDPDR